METNERRFLYQPNPLSSVIDWSWTLMIFLLSMVVWLEYTNFQGVTLTLLIIFAVICWAEIHFRNIVVARGQLVVSTVFNHHKLQIPLTTIQQVTTTRYRLGFVVNGRIYQFILPRNSVIELGTIIQRASLHQTV